MKMYYMVLLTVLWLVQNNAHAQDTLNVIPPNTGIKFWRYHLDGIMLTSLALKF
jgi:hypothetical protein